MAEISPTELSDRLRDGDDESEDVLVLDIRHRDEYDEWHVPDSVNIDIYDELTDDPETAKDALEDLPGRPRDRHCLYRRDRFTDRSGGPARDGLRRQHAHRRHERVEPRSPERPCPDRPRGTLVQVARPGKGCLSHVLISDGEAAVFDPSHYLEEYEAIIDAHDAELVGVFDTHAHADHVSGGADSPSDTTFRTSSIRRTRSRSTRPRSKTANRSRSGRSTLRLSTRPATAKAASRSISRGALLTGDTLFHESVGRVELGVEAGLEDSDVEGNAATLYESLQRLLDRPDDAVVLPTHDPGSPEPPVTATLGDVKAQNADLGREREEFVETLASDILTIRRTSSASSARTWGKNRFPWTNWPSSSWARTTAAAADNRRWTNETETGIREHLGQFSRCTSCWCSRPD